MQTKTLLIDGDMVVHKATVAVEQEIRWDDEVHTLHSSPDDAKRIIENQIAGWVKKLDADAVVVAFSDSENFRKSIYPEYKGNRKDKRKPVAFLDVRNWMSSEWKTYVRPTLEADDVLGILSTSDRIIRGQKIIVSSDKDMLSIPGYVFNPDKDEKPVFVMDAEADRAHLFQTLVGDATDNYPGCPGVGTVGANKLLDENEGDMWWTVIVKTFKKKGLTEEDALVQARLARILRKDDYDFKAKTVKLWRPDGYV